MSYNWFIEKKPDSLKDLCCKDHLRLKWYLSEDEFGERTFLATTVTIGYFFGNVVRLTYEICIIVANNPEEEKEIVNRMYEIIEWIDRATE